MATQSEQIAISQQRQNIPAEMLLFFDDWTNEALDSLTKDAKCAPKRRAYAGWELEYREAFGIELFYDKAGELHRGRRQ